MAVVIHSPTNEQHDISVVPQWGPYTVSGCVKMGGGFKIQPTQESDYHVSVVCIWFSKYAHLMPLFISIC